MTTRKRHITTAEFVNSTILPLMILISVGVWASFILLVWSVRQPLPRAEIIHERVVEVPVPAGDAKPKAATREAQLPDKAGSAVVNGKRKW